MASQDGPSSPASSSVTYFRSIPWCAAHLNAANITISDPPAPRKPSSAPPRKPETPEGKPRAGQLWSVTLNTPDTFPYWLTFHAEPADPTALVAELKGLLRIEKGVTGFPGVAHGGIVTTILDELLGHVLAVNRRRGALSKLPSMTAGLETRYLRPVPVPGTLLVVARITGIEGRKTFTKGWIEDEAGNRLAEADAMFLTLKPRV